MPLLAANFRRASPIDKASSIGSQKSAPFLGQAARCFEKVCLFNHWRISNAGPVKAIMCNHWFSSFSDKILYDIFKFDKPLKKMHQTLTAKGKYHMLDRITGVCKKDLDNTPLIKLFSKALKEKNYTRIHMIKDKIIGTNTYSITVYRSPVIQANYDMFIVFRMKIDTGYVPDMIIRHNSFTTDENIRETFDLYFKTTSKSQIANDISNLRFKGFLKMDSIITMKKRTVKGSRHNAVDEAGQKIFVLVKDYSYKTEQKMAA